MIYRNNKMIYKDQTSVDWLYSQLPEDFRFSDEGVRILRKAKEIHKQQTKDAYDTGYGHAERCVYPQGDDYYHDLY
jgi:hypothetical protein